MELLFLTGFPYHIFHEVKYIWCVVSCLIDREGMIKYSVTESKLAQERIMLHELSRTSP